MNNPRVTDNDKGEITITLEGQELRGWSYVNAGERRQKMLQAREYIEGWCEARSSDHAQGSLDCGTKAYVERAIASYAGDPADSQFQKGFLAALGVVRDEAFVEPDRQALYDQNWKDADVFCKCAFGAFVVDVSQYTKIVSELMQHATDRALALPSTLLGTPEDRTDGR